MKEVARAIIVNEHGRVLLGERVKGISKGEYSLLGGKCDDDEQPTRAISREIGEELPGTRFTPTRLITVKDTYLIPDDPITTSYFYGTTDHPPKLDMPVKPDEIGGLIFVGPEDIANVGIPIAFDHRERLEDFFSSPTYFQMENNNTR